MMMKELSGSGNVISKVIILTSDWLSSHPPSLRISYYNRASSYFPSYVALCLQAVFLILSSLFLFMLCSSQSTCRRRQNFLNFGHSKQRKVHGNSPWFKIHVLTCFRDCLQWKRMTVLGCGSKRLDEDECDLLLTMTAIHKHETVECASGWLYGRS